jgi:heme exporter protein A
MTATDRSTAEAARIDRVIIERVVKTFGATAALRGVDVELTGGRLTLIEGANGSGKTTLLRILGTVLKPSSGRVRYPPIGDDPARARAHIGWVSHDHLCYGDISGRDNIHLVARAHGLDPESSWLEARERFELGRFAERPLRDGSRGQRQRVALARALVHRPTLLLLDEPTTGLDRAGVARLVAVVREEVEGGALVALVSHEPEIFHERPYRRIVLERGRVIES